MKSLASNTLLQNRYLVVHLIGRGGMGEVYLAIDQRLGNAVALKRTAFFEDETLGGAFEREARTLARLRHAALPKVSDHFIEDGNQYLVMEYIAGDDLAKRLETSGKPFPLEWVAFWADRLLDALDHLHKNEPPIIHRDIKPQNLKLTEDNQIVLLDFGLSKTSAAASPLSTSHAPSVVGYTPQYAPMEQIRGTGTDARSDIFSLSSTLYQLLTGGVPPDALTRADAILNEKPDPLAPAGELNPQVPDSVSEIILKGMEIVQDKRFASAREMQKVLRDALTTEIKHPNSFLISAAADSPVEAAPQINRQNSLKTNVESKPVISSNSLSAADGNSAELPPQSAEISLSNFASNDNSQGNALITSVPTNGRAYFVDDENSFQSNGLASPKTISRKKSPLIFSAVAAIFLSAAAIGFGFYIFNNPTSKIAAPTVGGSANISSPYDAATAAEAAKPAEINLSSEDEAAASGANPNGEKQPNDSTEKSNNPKIVQPQSGVKTNQKPAQQISESKTPKTAVKPPAKTAPTPLPRILP